MTEFVYPGKDGSILNPKARYENYINGAWKAPVDGQYFENTSPTSGQLICEIPRSKAPDVELALDAAHAEAPKWGAAGPTERARVLNLIADRIEENIEMLALAEKVAGREAWK